MFSLLSFPLSTRRLFCRAPAVDVTRLTLVMQGSICRAARLASNIAPVIEGQQAAGFTSWKPHHCALNARGVDGGGPRGRGATHLPLLLCIECGRRHPRPGTAAGLWILELYRETIGQAGWCLPSAQDLNLLFETAERGLAHTPHREGRVIRPLALATTTIAALSYPASCVAC